MVFRGQSGTQRGGAPWRYDSTENKRKEAKDPEKNKRKIRQHQPSPLNTSHPTTLSVNETIIHAN